MLGLQLWGLIQGEVLYAQGLRQVTVPHRMNRLVRKSGCRALPQCYERASGGSSDTVSTGVPDRFGARCCQGTWSWPQVCIHCGLTSDIHYVCLQMGHHSLTTLLKVHQTTWYWKFFCVVSDGDTRDRNSNNCRSSARVESPITNQYKRLGKVLLKCSLYSFYCPNPVLPRTAPIPQKFPNCKP